MVCVTTFDDPVAKYKCSRCGTLRPGSEVARYNDRYLCHGYMDMKPTCYELDSFEHYDLDSFQAIIEGLWTL